jgi:hypothetical protein
MRWIVGLVIVVVLAGVLAYYYRAEMGAGSTAGAAYAASHAIGGCVSQSLSEIPTRTGMSGRMYLLAFSRSCLQRAAPDPSFCSEIPSSILEAASWIGGRCAPLSSDAKTCERIYQYAASACAGTLPGRAAHGRLEKLPSIHARLAEKDPESVGQEWFKTR